MTSNIGTRDIKLDKVFGFGEQVEGDKYSKMKSGISEDVKRIFSPEFLNRVDDLIVFHQLGRKEIVKIVDVITTDLLKRLKTQNIEVEITQEVKEYIAEKGFDENYGARPLKRTIQKYLEDPLSEEILNKKINEGAKLSTKVDLTKEKIQFEIIDIGAPKNQNEPEEPVEQSEDSKSGKKKS